MLDHRASYHLYPAELRRDQGEQATCGGAGAGAAAMWRGGMGAEEQRECATAIDARQLHQAESM